MGKILLFTLLFICNSTYVFGEVNVDINSQSVNFSEKRQTFKDEKEKIKKIIKGKTVEKQIIEWFGITHITSDRWDVFESFTRHIIPKKYSAPTENQRILFYDFRSGQPPQCPRLALLVTINKGTGVVEDFYSEEVIAECD
jgi:hypothetical protein